MAKAIKLQDLKKVLTLATSSTKKLVEAGVKHDKNNFPEYLQNYKWSGTRDFNMALIIIALYAYCLKSTDPGLKDITIREGRLYNTMSSDSTLLALEKGDGKKLAVNLEKQFYTQIQKKILGIQDSKNDYTEDLQKIFDNGLFKQARKIKKWITNRYYVLKCISLLVGDASVTKIAQSDAKLDFAKDFVDWAKTSNTDLNKENEELRKCIKELGIYLEKIKKELTGANLTIEEQNKKIQELQEYKNRLDTVQNSVNEYIENTLAMSKDAVSKTESKKYKETLKKFESIKKETDTLSKTVDALLLDVNKKTLSKNKLSDEKRRKSMGDIPTITIDELKKARKNLKPTERND